MKSSFTLYTAVNVFYLTIPSTNYSAERAFQNSEELKTTSERVVHKKT